jgi:ribosomal protein L31E
MKIPAEFCFKNRAQQRTSNDWNLSDSELRRNQLQIALMVSSTVSKEIFSRGRKNPGKSIPLIVAAIGGRKMPLEVGREIVANPSIVFSTKRIEKLGGDVS